MLQKSFGPLDIADIDLGAFGDQWRVFKPEPGYDRRRKETEDDQPQEKTNNDQELLG